MKEDRAESQAQRQLLNEHIGLPGSGATRYAAAMYFYTQNQMSADMLEIYRACSKFDTDDPLSVARYEGVTISGPFQDAPEKRPK